MQKLVPEIVDTGDRGAAGTFRTNLGLNNVGPEEARVRLELVGSGGNILGTTTVQVPSNGLKQIDNVARVILAQAAATGVRGYVRVLSNQPMHVWASKIDNGTDDPSIVMGSAVKSGSGILPLARAAAGRFSGKMPLPLSPLFPVQRSSPPPALLHTLINLLGEFLDLLDMLSADRTSHMTLMHVGDVLVKAIQQRATSQCCTGEFDALEFLAVAQDSSSGGKMPVIRHDSSSTGTVCHSVNPAPAGCLDNCTKLTASVEATGCVCGPANRVVLLNRRFLPRWRD